MKTVFKKMMRDSMEDRIIRRFRQIYPHFEMDASILKVPPFPKIILYSNAPLLNPFIHK